MLILPLLQAIAAASLLGMAAFVALGLSARPRVALLVSLGLLNSATPLLVPPQQRLERWLAAIVALMVVLKLYDLERDARRGIRPSLRCFLPFLFNPFSYVLRRFDEQRPPSRREGVIQLAKGM